MKNMRLIHYGAKKYNKQKFKPISDIPFRNKPYGGLWASPVDPKYGWIQFCLSAGYGDLSCSFEFEFAGNVLTIDSEQDIEQLPWIEIDNVFFVSFQALCQGYFIYDAIYLTAKGEEETRFSAPKSLYGWDCESVLILNPDSIRPLYEETTR
jgi:hypothetical protein